MESIEISFFELPWGEETIKPVIIRELSGKNLNY